MNQITYKTTEDYPLHGALLLMAELIKVITDDKTHGKKLYNNNLETMNNAIDFIEKHIEKYPSLTGGDDE